jgi:glyoxylase-like metal-dependent hydrolase (beta-lactamase superfamily II)
MGAVKVSREQDGLWQFCEDLGGGHSVDAWLAAGERRALLIDALQFAEGVYSQIRELTSLPVDVLICHGHGDHTGPVMQEVKDAGGKVYIHGADIPLLTAGGKYSPSFFDPLEDGRGFDLGGIILEALLVPGHTPGSLAVLERRRRWLLSSDTIGSGPFWVQLPHSEPLHAVQDNIRALYEDLKQYPDLRIYPGHRYQSPEPLGLSYITDTLETLELILAGKLRGTPMEIPPHIKALGGAQWLNVKHKGSLGLVYNPENLQQGGADRSGGSDRPLP